jgi:phosphoglycolate phosphatase-like HAD superfamily hydrolase
VLAGIKATASAPGDCVMVGDSVTDIEVARAIGVRRIDYASKPGKTDRLISAGAATLGSYTSELARGRQAIHVRL